MPMIQRVRTKLAGALVAALNAVTVHAACVSTPDAFDTIVRGRLVRCENAVFHIQASGADRVYAEARERALARTDRRFHERIREMFEIPQSDVVAVFEVDRFAPIVPWQRGDAESVEMKAAPRELHEIVRYWWTGSPGSCDDARAEASIFLWVRSPCCDTIPGSLPCLVAMNYAEPAPESLRQALAEGADWR